MAHDRNQQSQGGQQAALNEVRLNGCDGVFDECRLIGPHLSMYISWQRGDNKRKPLPHRIRYRNRILSRPLLHYGTPMGNGTPPNGRVAVRSCRD